MRLGTLLAVLAVALWFGGNALATTGLTMDMPEIPPGVTITIDGNLDDWRWAADAGYGYTEADFFVVNGSDVPAEDLAFVVYLAWSDEENMIYVAVNVTDDVFNSDETTWISSGLNDDSIGLYIDADQSGGMYGYDEAINYWSAEAQELLFSVGRAATGAQLEGYDPFFVCVDPSREYWEVVQGVAKAPNAYYAANVEEPNWAVEIKMKIWDTLGPDPMSTDDWVEHDLTEGETIGFGINICDADAIDPATGVAVRETGKASFSGGEYWRNADDFSEAILLPAPEVAVSPASWGSLKALYR